MAKKPTRPPRRKAKARPAHQACYLQAGKRLDALDAQQQALFPAWMINKAGG